MSRAAEKSVVTLEDVGGTFKRFVTEAPKLVKALLGTAVFTTSRRVLGAMEANAPMDTTGGGLTPGEHIKLDLEETWKASYPLSAKIGIFNNDAQAHVALFNEYMPNEQPFMRPALKANEGLFLAEVTRALKNIERQFADGARQVPGTRG